MNYIPPAVEGEHVLLTGPIQGSFELADGTVVDVSPPVIAVSGQKQADEIAHLIGQHYATEGHPEVPDGFVYEPPKKSTSRKKG